MAAPAADPATGAYADPSAAWLAHAATREQLDFFEEEGYLIIPDALPPALVASLLAAADRVVEAEERAKGPQAGATGIFRAVARDDAFLELLDYPTTFPVLWDTLGWNIQHYISHLIVYPPERPP
jgi:hypothetical protein